MATLDGARKALQLWPDHAQLVEIVEIIERGLEQDSDTAVDGAKCMVEAICREVLHERGVEAEQDASVQRLVRTAMAAVGLQDDQAGGLVVQGFNGWLTAAQNLGELRNRFGVVSHGRARISYALRREQRLLAVHLAEALSTFLIEAHTEREPDLLNTRQPYEEDSLLNERLDELLSAGVDPETGYVVLGAPDVGDLSRLRPSQLLYDNDREAYVEAVNLLRPPRSIIIKTAPVEAAQGGELVFEERCYWGAEPELGDLAFVWFSGANSGLALSARVAAVQPVADRRRVTCTVRRTELQAPLSLSELAPLRDAPADRPAARLAHKLYRHAHNKIAALDDEEVHFLAERFEGGV